MDKYNTESNYLIEECSVCLNQRFLVNRTHKLCDNCNCIRLHGISLMERARQKKKEQFERQKEKKITPSVKEVVKVERKPLKPQNELDRLFSLIIRTAHPKHCHNCGKHGEIAELQAGHYLGRTNFNVRHDLRNALPLCQTCNYFDYTHTEALTKRLIELYGIDVIDDLNIKKIERFSPSLGQKEFIESMFKTLLKSLNDDTQRNIEKLIETQNIIDKLFLQVV